jgi:RHS repeat-associated protein
MSKLIGKATDYQAGCISVLENLSTRQSNDINYTNTALRTAIYFEFPSNGTEDCESLTGEAKKQCYCVQNNDCNNISYFFHSDHVGSATFLTDVNGQPYQFLLYLPFGELMAEQKAAGYSTPYKFTGKEMDGLTGLNYHGARYYDPALSLWHGVDPLTESTPDWTSYRYGFNNSIKYRDPNGLFEEETCPTCPNDIEYDQYRNSKNNYYYEDGIVSDTKGVVVTATKKDKANTVSDVNNHYNGVNDILFGLGLTQGRNLYNNNYNSIKQSYYEAYKRNKNVLPKPTIANKKFKAIKKYLAPEKFSGSSKLIRRAGILGIGLTGLKIYNDVSSDGMISTSSLVDGGLIIAGLAATVLFTSAAPIIGTGIIIYGAVDYIFDIGDKLDANTNQIKVGND